MVLVPARIIIVMGVSSSGKSVTGKAIGRRLHAPFLDGDDFHPAANKDKDVGDDKDKVARLEDQKSKAGRAAPQITPHVRQELAQAPSDQRQSLLTMRNAPKRQHEVTPETADPSLPRDPEGLQSLPEEDLRSMKDVAGRDGQSAKVSLPLRVVSLK